MSDLRRRDLEQHEGPAEPANAHRDPGPLEDEPGTRTVPRECPRCHQLEGRPHTAYCGRTCWHPGCPDPFGRCWLDPQALPGAVQP